MSMLDIIMQCIAYIDLKAIYLAAMLALMGLLAILAGDIEI